MSKPRICAAALIAATVTGCDKPAPPTAQARPVRTVTVERGAEGETVSLTGQVRAKDQVSLAFRLDGRMIERPVNVGDVLTAGQVVARLDPQIQQNALRSAQGNLSSLEAQLTEARLTFGRQQELVKDGWTPRAKFDEAQQKLLSRPGPGRRRSGTGAHRAGTAELHGLVRRCPGRGHRGRRRTGRSGPRRADDRAARASGRTRRRLRRARAAHSDGPARSAGARSPSPTTRPVRATGRVREVAPQADAATRTFQVKVGIIDPPEGMRAGIHRHRPHQAVRASRRGDPGERAHRGKRTPGRVGGRSAEPDRVPAQRGCPALRPGHRRDLAGAGNRRGRGHRRRADAAPGPEGPAAGSRAHEALQPLRMGAFGTVPW